MEFIELTLNHGDDKPTVLLNTAYIVSVMKNPNEKGCIIKTYPDKEFTIKEKISVMRTLMEVPITP